MHLGIDAQTLDIRAIEVTPNSVGDAPVLPALFGQIDLEALAVVDQIASLGNDCGPKKSALDALVGTDQAARAGLKRQEAIAAMADLAER